MSLNDLRTLVMKNHTAPPAPMVSICCLSFNHAPYIRQALDSFLAQRCTYPIEVIVHDDASTDGTAQLIQEYDTRYPELFYPILQSKNQYQYGLKHVLHPLYQRARGKYIAICEGDDYWTDPMKLQKQVDLLETTPSIIASTHDVAFIDERHPERKTKSFGKGSTRVLTLEDLFPNRAYHTSSLVFRASAYQGLYGQWLEKGFMSGDKILSLTLHSLGGIHYSDEQMAVYRRHSGGASTSKDKDRYMKSDVNLFRAFAKKLAGNQRKHLLDCATFFQVEAFKFGLMRKDGMKLIVPYARLLPYAGRSAHLPWKKFRFMGKELYWMFRAWAKQRILGQPPCTETGK